MDNPDELRRTDSFSPTPPLQEKINHNGFTNVPPLTQLLPPVIVLLSFLTTMVSINSFFTHQAALVIFNLSLLLDFFLVLYFWYQATSLVPTDSVQLRHLSAIQKGQQFDHSNLAVFCKICKTYTNTNCFHCKRCRRCVQFFDHHCKWLNNCIGAKNYFEFYALIVSTFVLLTLSVIVSCYCLAKIQVQSQQDKPVLFCSIVTVLIATVPLIWLTYLLCLHSYLIATKKSTIELILESRSKNRVTPKFDKKHPIFKISFSKPSNEKEQPKKGEKEEEMDSYSSETNQNLVHPAKEENSTIEASLAKDKGKGLPPLKVKNNFPFFEDKGKGLSSRCPISRQP